MKSAVIPQVRVEPELRAQLEVARLEGETLSSFVETSLRSAVEYRQMPSNFHQRGEVSWQDFLRIGKSASTESVLAKLQAKIGARRKQLRG